MELEQLLTSEYAEKFKIEIPDHRDDLIYIYKPQMISVPIKDLNITAHEKFIWLEISMKYSITLYLQSVSTHTTIF